MSSMDLTEFIQTLFLAAKKDEYFKDTARQIQRANGPNCSVKFFYSTLLNGSMMKNSKNGFNFPNKIMFKINSRMSDFSKQE